MVVYIEKLISILHQQCQYTYVSVFSDHLDVLHHTKLTFSLKLDKELFSVYVLAPFNTVLLHAFCCNQRTDVL